MKSINSLTKRLTKIVPVIFKTDPVGSVVNWEMSASVACLEWVFVVWMSIVWFCYVIICYAMLFLNSSKYFEFKYLNKTFNEPDITGLNTFFKNPVTSCCLTTIYFDFMETALLCYNAKVCVETFEMRDTCFGFP